MKVFRGVPVLQEARAGFYSSGGKLKGFIFTLVIFTLRKTEGNKAAAHIRNKNKDRRRKK